MADGKGEKNLEYINKMNENFINDCFDSQINGEDDELDHSMTLRFNLAHQKIATGTPLFDEDELGLTEKERLYSIL